jgi:predicted amidohydrolase YtcJ
MERMTMERGDFAFENDLGSYGDSPAPVALQNRDGRQRQVNGWCVRAFGADHAASIPQRGIRMLEESAEAAQATGVSREIAHKLIDYVWDRPKGELAQELGGVGVTLLALAEAAALSADTCEQNEIVRVLSKPIEHFAKRNRVKNDAGFNVASPEPEPTK